MTSCIVDCTPLFQAMRDLDQAITIPSLVHPMCVVFRYMYMYMDNGITSLSL